MGTLSIVEAAEVARIKGSTTRELLLWYERKHGAGASVPLVEGLPPDLARLVDTSRPALGFLASAWYPVTLTHHLLDRALMDRTDEGRATAREAVRDITPRMIRGVYKVLFQAVASPELYARHIGRQWRRLHTTGDRTLVLRAPGEALSTVASWGGHHPFLCWMTIYTMESLFEAMRYKSVSVERIRCVSHGAADCATILRYR